MEKLANKSKAHTKAVQPRGAYKYAPPHDLRTGDLITLNATSSYAYLNRSSSQAASFCGPTDNKLGSEHTQRASS